MIWLIWLGLFVVAVAWEAFMNHWMAPSPVRTVDWEHVYAMEREVWHHTFDHAGAPAPKVSRTPDLQSGRSLNFYQNCEAAYRQMAADVAGASNPMLRTINEQRALEGKERADAS